MTLHWPADVTHLSTCLKLPAVAVVGALIFVLGIDLVKEAVWDTRHRVNRWEYITIWAIAIGMTM
jgi:MFS superfamily sulfate permease-like transporter